MVKSEAGFSTIEVIVATLLLSVGVLGTARVSGDMTRVLSLSDRMATSALYSQEQIETLRAGGCAAIVAGNDTRSGGFTLDWTVDQPTGSRTKLIRMVATYAKSDGFRSDTVETSVTCP